MPRQARSILIVEDDPDDEFRTINALRDAGFVGELSVAAAAEQALDRIFGAGNDEPLWTPDLILVEIHLRGGSGFRVLEAVKRNRRTEHIPVILMTRSSTIEDVSRGYELHANSIVEKTPAAMRVLVAYWTTQNLLPWF